MSASPRIGLSYLAPQQAQKHVTVNETFRRLDVLVQLSVVSATTAAEPASPVDGDAYILPAGKTGTDWAAFTDLNIAAFQDGAWVQIDPIEGFRAWIADTDEFVFYDGAAWAGPDRWGVGVAPDAANRLSVKSNAVLLDALDAGEGGTGDSRVKVNKEAAGDTASHLFQTGFSGRAEFGLTGDDDFHLKVSADGSSWKEAFVVDKAAGVLHSAQAVISGANGFLTAGVDQTIVGFQLTRDGFAEAHVSSHDAGGNPSVVGYRSRGTFAAPTIVQNADFIFSFFARGYDGSAYKNAAGLRFAVDGTPGANDMPGRITFHTSADGTASFTERMRVTSAGDVGIGATSPATKLDVDGPVKVKSYTVAGAPSAAGIAGAIIYVSDETGGATLAFSDGTDWRRVQDRAVIA
ncbi:MAG: DUF2793 domain-containing protein [Parvularculaceae bacterium]